MAAQVDRFVNTGNNILMSSSGKNCKWKQRAGTETHCLWALITNQDEMLCMAQRLEKLEKHKVEVYHKSLCLFAW